MNEKAELALMEYPCRKPKDNLQKWYLSLRTALLFFIVSSPFLYRIVNQTLGKMFNFSISTGSGCPNMGGLVLHTIVFGLLLRGLMEI